VAVAEATAANAAAANNDDNDQSLPAPLPQSVVRDQLYRLAVTDKHVE
jgi:hypothetical protein